MKRVLLYYIYFRLKFLQKKHSSESKFNIYVDIVK